MTRQEELAAARAALHDLMTGMTVETARRILAAAPQSAQARSDTALDRLMQGAPAPLAAGNPASDAVNDLLNTPV
ncbi:hypothetical protein LAW41_11510 [Escherichia coli]|nr:hypothetical protein [Escherichia coli]MDD8375115.1 hypothetical protein [Escherichia coli]